MSGDLPLLPAPPILHDRIRRHHSHYALECPNCRATVESCGCTAPPRYTAALPCKTCTGKLAAEFPHVHSRRPRSRWKLRDGE